MKRFVIFSYGIGFQNISQATIKSLPGLVGSKSDVWFIALVGPKSFFYCVESVTFYIYIFPLEEPCPDR